ncbi:MAG: InlB B-repeat-containing protein [Clostridia bacterium]|nr:InlB B-repeat-containing protein [Clostridia bacterium]
MKKITRIVVVLLALVMLLPVVFSTVSAAEAPELDVNINQLQLAYFSADIRCTVELSDLKTQKRLNSIDRKLKAIKKSLKKQEDKAALDAKKDKVEKYVERGAAIANALVADLPKLKAALESDKNNGGVNTAGAIEAIWSAISNIVACCGPYGQVASAIMNAATGLVKLFLGGEAPASEMAQMEDRLNQQFDQVKNQLSGIEEQIDDLSNQINDSTNEIINETASAIDNANDKAKLETFMLSGEGNFSYNQYRNYIYGSIVGNSKSTTAYYALLKNAIKNNASDEVIKNYYDLLYTSLMNDRDEYYDYITGTESSKSIVQCYYDVVSKNDDLVEEDSSPELMAILFAYDVYQTERMTNDILAFCNLYQYEYMLSNGTEQYVYDKATGAAVTRAQIEGIYSEDENGNKVTEMQSLYEVSMLREEEIRTQFARDIVYILAIEDSYVIKSTDDRVYEIANNDSQTFGNVIHKQTVYLNQIPDSACELFDIDKDDYKYDVNVSTSTDGVFYVDSSVSSVTARLMYRDEELTSMNFNVGTNGKFQGGSGTAEDPYLIATVEQFLSISEEMDKHYCLIGDIDFEEKEIAPLGERINSSQNVVYDKFTGSLNGNGYTVSNFTVKGNKKGTSFGLFGEIGPSGQVSDLTLYNVKVSPEIDEAKTTATTIYAGVIAGNNEGNIRYCTIDSSLYNGDDTDEVKEQKKKEATKTVTITNIDELLERNLTEQEIEALQELKKEGYKDICELEYFDITLLKYPALTSQTKEVLYYPYGLSVTVDNSQINRNIYVYAGGVAGVNNNMIAFCQVNNSHISASSTHSFGGNDTVKNQNNVYTGGLCGRNNGAVGYSIVDEGTVVSTYVKSIYNPDSTVYPFINAQVGGLFGTVTRDENIYAVESNACYTKAKYELKCQSGYGTRKSNCKLLYDETPIEKSPEDIMTIINRTGARYDIELSFGDINSNNKFYDCVYRAGESSKQYFVYEKTEKTDGISTDYYECESLNYSLALSSNGKGVITDSRSSIEFEYTKDEDGRLIIDNQKIASFGISSLTVVSLDGIVAEINSLRTDNLKVFAGGIEREYEILDVYGFDTMNESDENVTMPTVFLLAVKIGESTVYYAKEVDMTVEKDEVVDTQVENLKNSYVSGTFKDNLGGITIKETYRTGKVAYTYIKESNISDVIIEGDYTTYGTRRVTLKYNDINVSFDIEVICGHGSNFIDEKSGYVHIPELSKESTCSEIGYDYYECSGCGDIKLFYLRKLEHTPDYDSIEKPSCTDESVIGKVDCAVCKAVLAEGVLVPKQAHDYIYFNENLHRCDNGEHFEAHHYSVSEEVRLLDNKNGTQSWYIVYTYTCVCKKDGKVFTKEVVDENEITEEERELPTVAVSNGYVLNGGDLVVVYVQLINNPGVKAVNFGIRYSDGLELVGTPQNGDLFKGSMVSESGAVDYGYNFLLANSALIEGDGNILKLTFKVTEAAKLGDVYDISVVYSDMGASKDGVQIEGGFSNGTRINVVTRDGYIKVVEDLPGDVNDDGTVDLMDAVLLAKFYVNSSEYPLETKEADLNLDKAITPDDIVALLEYIVGGYGTNLMTQDFEIVLNTNGLDYDLNDIDVSIYDENSTYGEAGLVELNRTGYKFLGWFDKISGGNKVTPEDAVKYNPNQKKQMLYAQWELNALVFDGNGATEGDFDDIYYTGDYSISLDENEYKKEYNVSFVSDNQSKKDVNDILKYKLLYWKGDNGIDYSTLAQAVTDLNDKNYGKVILTAVWTEEPTITFPDMIINGYEKDVSWYGDKSYSMVTEINSNVDILNYEPINGYYMVYAKHTPIVYDVMVDFNGGTGIIGGSTENADNKPYIADCSVENPYDLTKIKITSDGRTISGWDITVDGEYYGECGAGTSIGYLPTVKKDSLVTIKALWDMKSYKITYTLNGGVVLDNEEGNEGRIDEREEAGLPTVAFGTYRVDTIENISLLEPVYKEYYKYHKFVGWFIDETLTQPLEREALKANPQDVILYAKWDLCATYDHTNTPAVINNKLVIIDWSQDASAVANRGTIFVEDATEIYIIGNNSCVNNVNITLSSTKDHHPVSMELKNLNICGSIAKADLSKIVDLTLMVQGECLIEAPQGLSAISDFDDLYLGNTIVPDNESGLVNKTGALALRLSCYGDTIIRPIYSTNVVVGNEYDISTRLDAKNASTGDSSNTYKFNGWFLDGVACSSFETYSFEGKDYLTSLFTTKWYQPLKIEETMINKDDFSNIGSTESRIINVYGGTGSYKCDINVSGSGATASYDENNKIFTVKKKSDGASGSVRIIFTDKTTGQTISKSYNWSTNGCFTGDTLVTLADGSVARLDSLKQGDIVLSWNPIAGRLEPMPISMFWNHGDGWYNVITLGFSNGKTLKVVEEHGFFDITLNEFVYIHARNYKDYIGHSFACLDENGVFENAVLISSEMEYVYTSCYSLRSACNDNVIVNGFMTLTIEDVPGMLTYFEFGEDYMYDKEKMEADIETYGLYTYEEWKDYVSYEEFVALNGQYFKILVGKGYLTIDDIFVLIAGMR